MSGKKEDLKEQPLAAAGPQKPYVEFKSRVFAPIGKADTYQYAESGTVISHPSRALQNFAKANHLQCRLVK